MFLVYEKKKNIVFALLSTVLSHQVVFAQFSVELDLSDLNGQNGFIINGENAGDELGYSVSSAGDVNGDGIDDLIIGANGARHNGESSAGNSYVIFGNEGFLSGSFNLPNLNGKNGFVINGQNGVDFSSGWSVSSAGDVNGDGVDDLIIGASNVDPNHQLRTGKSYVIFGSLDIFPRSLNLATLNGDNGFVINGENRGDYLAQSVSSAGDVNNDGVDDLIIGALGADPDGRSNAGKSYVIFGSDEENGLSHPFNLIDINGENGFVIIGENADDFLGYSVSSAGDVNKDGIDDLIIGAYRAESDAGKSYVIFGSDEENGLPHPFNLIDINGENGFVINGENDGDESGRTVSSAGDVNGDGVDDLIIGAYKADSDGRPNTGKSYVVYGSKIEFPSQLNLSTLDDENGFVINGKKNGDGLGRSVSSAGDFNNDGVSDMIIGAPNNKCDNSGKSYVIFGMNDNNEVVFRNGFDCI